MGGWAFVGNESNALRKPIIRRLLELLERIPNNSEHDLRIVQGQFGHAGATTRAMYVKTNGKACKRQVEALEIC